jgi:glutamine amidotransferase
MCELFSMSARYPTNVTFSLKELARHGGETGDHSDGWGVAFYEGVDARILREVTPAAECSLMEFLQNKGIRSNLVLSHIRKATEGEVNLANAHPFQRELGGHIHTFAHNGQIDGIRKHPSQSLGRFRPVGNTDSEFAFCSLLSRLEEAWLQGIPSLQYRFDIVSQIASEWRPLGPANFLYSDGDVLFVHGHKRTQADGEKRPPGLHLLSRQCHMCDDSPELLGVQVDESRRQSVALVASVPLSNEAWYPLGEGELLVLRDGHVLERF